MPLPPSRQLPDHPCGARTPWQGEDHVGSMLPGPPPIDCITLRAAHASAPGTLGRGDRRGSKRERRADRSTCLHGGGPRQGGRAGHRARVRGDPDLPPEPPRLAADRLLGRRLRRLSRVDERLRDRDRADSRRVPDQLREQGAGSETQVDRLAGPCPADRRRDRSPGGDPPCRSAKGRAPRGVDEARRKGDRTGPRREQVMSAAAREHRRHPGAPGARLRRARSPARALGGRWQARGVHRLLPPARLRARDPHPPGVGRGAR
jgi:hypothetical protein